MPNGNKTVLFEVAGLTSEQYREIINKLNQILVLLKPDFTTEDTAVTGMTEKLKEAIKRVPSEQPTKGT